MTTDEVKAWLRSYRSLQLEVQRIEEEQLYWRARAEKVTQSCSGLPGSGSSGDNIPKCVERIEKLEKQLEAKLQETLHQRERIEKIVDSLPNKDMRLALQLKYIDGLTWEKIGEKMYCSERWAQILHGRALQIICKQWDGT